MAKCKTGQVWNTKINKCVSDKSSLKYKMGTGKDEMVVKGATRIKGKSDPRFNPKRGKSEAVASGIRTDKKMRKSASQSTRGKVRTGLTGRDPRFSKDRSKPGVQGAIKRGQRRRAAAKRQSSY